jgi:NAD(P)H-hydrate epimerase
MAKAGSGDVLSGFCAGLCGFGMNAFAAAICAAWLCGKAGQTAAWEYGEYAMTPSDTVKFLGEAFLFVAEETDKQGAKA